MVLQLERLAPLVLAIVFACTPADDRATNAPTVVDSAGVAIITNGETAAEWQLADTPSLVIGTLEGPSEELFTRIMSVFRMPDGRIVAANFNTPPEVRFYSAVGEHLRSVGGAGEGPGEFTAIAWLRRTRGDTLLVHDPWTSRITLLSGTGDLLKTIPIASVGGLMPNRVSLRGMFHDGSLLGRPNSRLPPDVIGSGRHVTPIFRVSRDLTQVDTLVIVSDLEYSTPGSEGAEPVTFGTQAVLYPAGDRLIVGPGDSFEFQEYDLTGRHMRSVHWEQRLRPVTDADVDALVAARTAEAQDREDRLRIEEVYRRRDVADEMPPYDQIRTDRNGNVWVRDFAMDGEDATWRVFSERGELLATLVTPAPFRVHEIGPDYVLGVWRDELDVESIRLYGLLR